MTEFYKKFTAVIVTLGLIYFLIQTFFVGRYLISIDDQYFEKCLPYTLFIGDKDAIESIKVGNLAYFKSEEIEPGLKKGQLVVKIVAAVYGDIVRVKNNRLWINGVDYGELRLNKTLRKNEGDYDRSIEIKKDELFMLGTLPGSFDSRYWGPINKSQVVAKGYAII